MRECNGGVLVGSGSLDNNRPEFGEPTLGTLVGSSFYYIANSQWGGYAEAGVIKPFDMLQDIYILKKDLK